MDLKKGITLHSLVEDGYSSVFINSGTLPYQQQQLHHVQFQGLNFIPLFEEDAFLPKRDWRGLTNREIRNLRSTADRKDYNTVYTGELPAAIQEIFKTLELGNSTSREEVMTKFRAQPKVMQVLNIAMQDFLNTISGDKPFHFHCIAANLPNLELVACDITRLAPNFTLVEKRYIGMHNDGTQFMRLHTTHKFGNRITINLGKEPRAFYFVNLTMIQVVNMLKHKINTKMHQLSIHNVPSYFFQYFPDYPVIKVVQKPYQYYIAATDNCFHDGSTLGNTSLDINMVYFGAFKC